MPDNAVTPTPQDAVTVVPDGMVVFGLQLPIQSQSRRYVDAWELEAGPAELAQVARAADAHGFFYVGVCDHTAIPERLAATMGTTWYDTVATLGWIAGFTEHVRLLSHVLVLPQRHPLRTAKEMATLDLLSGGRVLVGVGAGHVPEEYALFGGDFSRRGRDTDEAVVALAAALRDEFPVLPGPRWAVSGMGVSPRPVQTPRPPIWVGGSSMPAIRRAAALGDGWLPQGTPRAELPGQIQMLRQFRSELRQDAPMDIGTIAEPLYLVGDGVGDAKWELPAAVVRGGPDVLAHSLRGLVAMGVDHVQVRFACRSADELCDQMAGFAESVVPLVRS